MFLYGWIPKRNLTWVRWTWVRLPKDNDEAINILAKAGAVSKALTHCALHGVLFGRALRPMKPPAGTAGTLLTWIHGGRSYAVQEHNTDTQLQMKKISNHNKEDVCVLYFFYCTMASEEVMNPNVFIQIRSPCLNLLNLTLRVQWMRIQLIEREKDQRLGRLCCCQRRSAKGSHSSSPRWSSCDIGTTLQLEIFKFNWTFAKIGERAIPF